MPRLKMRVVALNGVDADARTRLAVSISVFLTAVVYNVMLGELFAEPFVAPRFVGHQVASRAMFSRTIGRSPL